MLSICGFTHAFVPRKREWFIILEFLRRQLVTALDCLYIEGGAGGGGEELMEVHCDAAR